MGSLSLRLKVQMNWTNTASQLKEVYLIVLRKGEK